MLSRNTHPQVKWVRSLHKARHRNAEGVALVEGPRPISALVDAPERIIALFATETAWHHPATADLLNTLEQADVSPIDVTDSVLAAMADTRTPQGVLAVVRTVPAALADVLDRPGDILVLDGVQDPGNVGTLIRAAAAVGIAGVVLTGACADATGPKAVRASAGALFHTPYLHWDGSVEDLAAQLTDAQVVPWMATGDGDGNDGNGDAVASPGDVIRTPRVAWVLGAEVAGVSAPWHGVCAGQVALPMAPGVESLNVAMAGTVLLYSRVLGTPPPG